MSGWREGPIWGFGQRSIDVTASALLPPLDLLSQSIMSPSPDSVTLQSAAFCAQREARLCTVKQKRCITVQLPLQTTARACEGLTHPAQEKVAPSASSKHCSRRQPCCTLQMREL